MPLSELKGVKATGLAVTLGLVLFSIFSSVSVLSTVRRDDHASVLWIPELPDLMERLVSLANQVNHEEKLEIWQYNNPFFRNPTRDTFCHGCRVNQNRRLPCGKRDVLQPAGMKNLSAITPEDLPEVCRSCLDCPERDHWYGRFDEAAPPVVQAVSHYLPSIPEIHRFPHNLSSWLDYFEASPANRYPQRQYFAEYNPSIVRIPENQIPMAFRGDGVVYIASFRVTERHFCHKDSEEWLSMLGYPGSKGVFPEKGFSLPPSNDHLALALLREDLTIVSDAVFDLGGAKLQIEDSRLFNLDDKLYWSAGRTLHPFWIVEETAPDIPLKLSPKFANRDRPWTTPLTIQRKGVCSVEGNPGKNLQFFVDPSDGTVVTELYPTGRKIAIDVNKTCPGSIIGERPLDNTAQPSSFGTVDELHFWKHNVHLYSVLTGERGSACCVAMKYEDRDLLLGISHSKFKFRSKTTRDSLPGNVSANHFFSTFYLMDAGPPYSVVARSGKFCLGFPDKNEAATQNPYGRATISRKVRLGGDYFDCPAIHFVSGLVDTPDGDHLWIAYGVGDCSPRMIKVRKSDVLRILFPVDE